MNDDRIRAELRIGGRYMFCPPIAFLDLSPANEAKFRIAFDNPDASLGHGVFKGGANSLGLGVQHVNLSTSIAERLRQRQSGVNIRGVAAISCGATIGVR